MGCSQCSIYLWDQNVAEAVVYTRSLYPGVPTVGDLGVPPKGGRLSGAKLSRCYDRGLDEALEEAAGLDDPGGAGLVEIGKRATTNPGKKVAKQ